jgi:hypothetical protein
LSIRDPFVVSTVPKDKRFDDTGLVVSRITKEDIMTIVKNVLILSLREYVFIKPSTNYL